MPFDSDDEVSSLISNLEVPHNIKNVTALCPSDPTFVNLFEERKIHTCFLYGECYHNFLTQSMTKGNDEPNSKEQG